MKKKLLLIALLVSGTFFAQTFSTAVTTLGTTGMTIKIATDPTTVTLTLTGSSTQWLGIGFGGTSMSSVSDMFIWNATVNRDYTPSGIQSSPSPDSLQSWTVTSDTVASGIRTVVATRALVSSGDYTFVNSNATLPIIFAIGSGTTSLSQHSDRGAIGLSRTLGLDDFSLNEVLLYPNPSNGNFLIKTKTTLSKVNVYNQSGAFVKNIQILNGSNDVEVNLNGLQSGIYFIELQGDSQKYWKKVVVN
jgi:hypothetical protein